MAELKEKSSRPECKDTVNQQIQKLITPELIYKQRGITLQGAKMENVQILHIKEGEYMTKDKGSELKWNRLFEGDGQLIVPDDSDCNQVHKTFEGYANVNNDKCEKIHRIITIKD